MELYTISKQQIEEENARVQAVDSYGILDTLPEKEYDDLAKLASYICDVPVSLIAVMDRDRNWYKAVSNDTLGISEMKRKDSFCRITVEKNELFEIPDTDKDDRFYDNPVVVDGPKVKFYAGYPLINKDGHKIGTLCVIDNVPRKLNLIQREALRTLANQVINNFELRKKTLELEKKETHLVKNNEKLKQFAHVVSHDLKTPLNNIVSLNELVRSDPNNVDLYLEKIDKSITRMKNLINGILTFAESSGRHNLPEATDIYSLVSEIINELPNQEQFTFEINPNLPKINTQKVLLIQVFQNLIGNAIKYNDKENGLVKIGFSYVDSMLIFSVSDNGPGIPEEHYEDIFEPFKRLVNKDEVEGIGIGLASITNILDERGDKIWVESNSPEGTTFSFSWSL